MNRAYSFNKMLLQENTVIHILNRIFFFPAQLLYVIPFMQENVFLILVYLHVCTVIDRAALFFIKFSCFS